MPSFSTKKTHIAMKALFEFVIEMWGGQVGYVCEPQGKRWLVRPVKPFYVGKTLFFICNTCWLSSKFWIFHRTVDKWNPIQLIRRWIPVNCNAYEKNLDKGKVGTFNLRKEILFIEERSNCPCVFKGYTGGSEIHKCFETKKIIWVWVNSYQSLLECN